MLRKFLLTLSFIFVLIICTVIVISMADNIFNSSVHEEIGELYSAPNNSYQSVDEVQLESLPNPVKKWLKSSGIPGKVKSNSVRLKQKGFMLPKRENDWMPFEAYQYYRIDKPGFIWQARANAGWPLYITARDKYYEGKGNMLIKLFSLFTIADSKGEKMDQGTMLRYLAEICWFPFAALSDYIEWQSIDSTSARAVMNYKDRTVAGTFFFKDNGDISGFEAMRYGEFEGKFSLEKWHVSMNDYSTFQGIRIPVKGSITWKLKTGDFKWLNWEIYELDYNNQLPY
ncbi:MAG: hypothetical protein KKB34_02865 [Bacteroidetes bacterium]|nr:hypothetical protein [Bacteroidota bacterium]